MNPNEVITNEFSSKLNSLNIGQESENAANNWAAKKRIDQENHAIWLGMDVTKRKIKLLESRIKASHDHALIEAMADNTALAKHHLLIENALTHALQLLNNLQ